MPFSCPVIPLPGIPPKEGLHRLKHISNFRTLKEISNQLMSYGSHINVQCLSLEEKATELYLTSIFRTLVHGHTGLMGIGFLLHLKMLLLQVHKY